MCHHHHRINVPIAGAQTFLMDRITLGEIYVDIKLVRIVHNVAAASLRYTSNLDQVTEKCISAIKYYNVNND
jgi:virulence-associated protein VapD